MDRHARTNSSTLSQVHVHHREREHAFVPDPSDGTGRVADEFAEALAESYLATALSGEEQASETLDHFVVEELGGPFIDEDNSPDLLRDGLPASPETRNRPHASTNARRR